MKCLHVTKLVIHLFLGNLEKHPKNDMFFTSKHEKLLNLEGTIEDSYVKNVSVFNVPAAS